MATQIQNGEYLETWNGTTLVSSVISRPHAPPIFITFQPFNFYRKFTQAERIAARTLSLTDNTARDFMHLLDNAVSSGTPILSNDPDIVSGMNYLSITPSVTPVLAAGRATIILS